MSIFVPLWYFYGMPVGLAIGVLVVAVTGAFKQSKLGSLLALTGMALQWPAITLLFVGATTSAILKMIYGSPRSS